MWYVGGDSPKLLMLVSWAEQSLPYSTYDLDEKTRYRENINKDRRK